MTEGHRFGVQPGPLYVVGVGSGRRVTARSSVTTSRMSHLVVGFLIEADQIVVLDHGRIIAIGTHAELLQTNELYARLAALQFADLSTAEKRVAVGG